MLLLTDVAKLPWREGALDRSTLDSPLLDVRFSSWSKSSAGKAQAKPLVGAAAMGSGMPDTLLGLGLMTGARRGGWLARGAARLGDRGEVPLGRASGFVMPRCCWRFETSETRDAFWLSYGDCG